MRVEAHAVVQSVADHEQVAIAGYLGSARVYPASVTTQIADSSN